MPHTTVPPTEATTAWGPVAFSCLRSDDGRAARVAVAGELDIATVPQADHALRCAEADAPLVVLDLRALEFMDLGGAQLLLAAHRRIRRAGGRLVVVRGPAEVGWFLALTGLDHELELVDQPPMPSERSSWDGVPA